MVDYSLKAAQQLEGEGVSVEVIDLRTLSPWDKEMVLESVAKTGRFVAVDESYPTCGAASEWAATVAEYAFDYLKAPVARVTGKPVPIPFSPVLEKAVIPNVDEIVAAVKKTMVPEKIK
jgi:pyruvate dehydrogenase E1 component beta subunit